MLHEIHWKGIDFLEGTGYIIYNSDYPVKYVLGVGFLISRRSRVRRSNLINVQALQKALQSQTRKPYIR